MKQAIKNLLISRGLYNNFKYSRLFWLYQYLFKKEVIVQHKTEGKFYQSFLTSTPLIFDIGANDGHKTAAFLSIAQKVVCCEPDEENLSILYARFRNKKHRVFIEPLAITDKTGTVDFLLHHKGSAFNTLNPRWKDVLEKDKLVKWNELISFSKEVKQVPATTLDELIKKYGVPGFIKIDVEGGEQNVLSGLSQRIACISFECLLPDFKPELLECLQIINRLEYTATYNIASYEKLLLPNFIQLQELLHWISNISIHHFEIIVKMNVGDQ
jgi:FkbM family methyltransferase